MLELIYNIVPPAILIIAILVLLERKGKEERRKQDELWMQVLHERITAPRNVSIKKIDYIVSEKELVKLIDRQHDDFVTLTEGMRKLNKFIYQTTLPKETRKHKKVPRKVSNNA